MCVIPEGQWQSFSNRVSCGRVTLPLTLCGNQSQKPWLVAGTRPVLSPRHHAAMLHQTKVLEYSGRIRPRQGTEIFQQLPRVTCIGSLPPENLGKSPAEPRRAPQNPRRDPAEPSERLPQSPLRGKFPRRASRRVVPLGW